MALCVVCALSISLIASGAGAAASTSAAPQAAEPQSVWAVIGLAGSGVWGADAERVEEAVRQALVRQKAGRVQGRAATAALLAEGRQAGIACDVREPSCAAKLGAYAGVTYVLLLETGAQAGRLRLDAALVDVATERFSGRAQREVDTGKPDPTVLDSLISEVWRPVAATGSIAVAGAPDGARVIVDGVERAVLPLAAPIANVAAGSRIIEVVHGIASWRGEVLVVANGVATVTPAFPTAPTADSAPEPLIADADAPSPQDAPRIGLPLAVAGGAALVVGGAGAGTLALLLESPMEHGARQGVRAGGVTLLGVAFLGAIAAGVGLALFLTEDPS